MNYDPLDHKLRPTVTFNTTEPSRQVRFKPLIPNVSLSETAHRHQDREQKLLLKYFSKKANVTYWCNGDLRQYMHHRAKSAKSLNVSAKLPRYCPKSLKKLRLYYSYYSHFGWKVLKDLKSNLMAVKSLQHLKLEAKYDYLLLQAVRCLRNFGF